VAAWRATSHYNSVGHFLALKNHPSRHVFAGGAYFAAARLPSFRLGKKVAAPLSRRCGLVCALSTTS
jgi:hypothetical protein